jgi:phosphatidylserine/phosphatidylglycerophosphate/cardiolipin synthase-like enzyme
MPPRKAARLVAALAIGLAALPAPAAPPRTELPAEGTVQYAFPPEDDGERLILAALRGAREQILAQAYSVTHRGIVDALIDARRRGVAVTVIVDARQAKERQATLADELAARGVEVFADSQHSAAHNKVVLVDAARRDCALVTGSYNLTYSAQLRNAENVLVLRGNAALCAAYAKNFERHRLHSHRLR